MRSPLVALMLGLSLVAGACSGSSSPTTTAESSDSTRTTAAATVPPTTVDDVSYAGTQAAPEFPDGLDWLNTERPLSLAELRGKVVLLDFWTYGCINCIHIIPDLHRLEQEYAEELVVIGVHSAKFTNEGETDNIRSVIQRYDLEHPVVNDRDFVVWRTWGAQAWPTLVLIDPAGNVVGGHSGEGVYPLFQPVIQSLVAEFDGRGQVDRTPIDFALEKEGVADSVLSFPGKVFADQAGGRLFVADTNHHRVVVADLETGEVTAVVGTGERGFAGGDFSVAQFDQPQGLALSADGGTLWVADLGNHAVRELDLQAGTVRTLVGTGEQSSRYPPLAGTAPDLELASPWALELVGDTLYVAMAGSHQIWQIDLTTGLTTPFTGNAREGTINGPPTVAELAQPSGLAVLDGLLYFADSESSAIRAAAIGSGDTVLVSGSDESLFDFGDVDGVGGEARLQHPLGLAVAGEYLYVADTYNSKLKRIDPNTLETVSWSGGTPGWADGPDPRYNEPGGLSVAGDTLYVADTNNHVIRRVDLRDGSATTMVLFGVERFARPEGFAGAVVNADSQAVAAGPGTLVVDIAIPAGFIVNDIAPYSMTWTVDGEAVELGPEADASIVEPTFPLAVKAEFSPGEATVTGEFTVYYCLAETKALCFFETVRVSVPVTVGGDGGDTATFGYAIPAPELP